MGTQPLSILPDGNDDSGIRRKGHEVPLAFSCNKCYVFDEAIDARYEVGAVWKMLGPKQYWCRPLCKAYWKIEREAYIPKAYIDRCTPCDSKYRKWKRNKKMAEEVITIRDVKPEWSSSWPCLVTLTVPAGSELRTISPDSSRRVLLKMHRRMREKSAVWRKWFVGGVLGVEHKPYSKESGFHPHIHAVCITRGMLDNKGKPLPHNEWSELKVDIQKYGFGMIFDVKRIDSIFYKKDGVSIKQNLEITDTKGLRRAIGYCTKYATKDLGKGRRVSRFGVMAVPQRKPCPKCERRFCDDYHEMVAEKKNEVLSKQAIRFKPLLGH